VTGQPWASRIPAPHIPHPRKCSTCSQPAVTTNATTTPARNWNPQPALNELLRRINRIHSHIHIHIHIHDDFLSIPLRICITSSQNNNGRGLRKQRRQLAKKMKQKQPLPTPTIMRWDQKSINFIRILGNRCRVTLTVVISGNFLATRRHPLRRKTFIIDAAQHPTKVPKKKKEKT